MSNTLKIHAEDDMNIVALWLRRDPIRWAAGIFGGALAGVVALFVAALFAQSAGMEALYPIKLFATPFLGNVATEYGLNMQHLAVGFVFIEAIFIFWGVVFAHFTQTNALKALVPMGVVWGLFSWVFLWNLFLPAFRSIKYAQLPAAPALAVCLTYGLALTSVAAFDRVFRSGKSARHR